MLNKTKKVLIGVFSAFTLLAGGVIVPTVITTLHNKSKPLPALSLMTERDWDNCETFRFNNKDYLSINDALKDFVNAIGGIKSESFVGELTKVEENGQVMMETNNFKPYNLSKMYQAFMDANGRYTQDYEQAMSSFINVANLVSMYYDFKGNFFIDEQDAKSSMGSFSSMGLVFYEIVDYLGEKHRINPLNKKDQLKLKKIALDFLQQKNVNNNDNPFKLVAIRKSNANVKSSESEVYSQANIFNVSNETIRKFNNIILNNLSLKIYDVIENFIFDNMDKKFFKLQLYIKPYSLKPGKPTEYQDPSNSSNNIKWSFNGDNRTNFLTTRDINLNEYEQLFKIFTKRSEFEKYFNIVLRRNVGNATDAGFRPSYEDAEIKNNNDGRWLKEIFNNRLSSVKKYNYYSAVNTLNDANKVVFATILKNSGTYDNWWDRGPKYKTNHILSFGLVPVINSDARYQILNEVKNKLLDESTNYLQKAIKECVNSILNSNDVDLDLKEYTEHLISLYGEDYKNYILIKEGTETSNIYDYFRNFNLKSNGEKKLINTELSFRKNDCKINNDKYKWEFDAPYWDKNVEEAIGVNESDTNNWLHSTDYLYMDYVKNKNEKHLHSVYHQTHSQNDAYSTIGFKNDFIREYYAKNTLETCIDLKLDYDNNLQFVHETNILSSDAINDYDYFITYNDVPLYQLNEDIIYPSRNYVDFNRYNFDFAKLFNTIYNNNQSLLLNSDLINTSNKTNNQLIDELFINVSSRITFDVHNGPREFDSFSFVKNQSQQLNNLSLSSSNKIILKDNNNLEPTSVYLPIDSDYVTLDSGLKNIVDIYNESYNSLLSYGSFGNEDILNANRVNMDNINDIVVLYDAMYFNDNKSFYPKDLIYAHTTEGANNLNLSLTDSANDSIIATNKNELNAIYDKLKVFSEPVKMYFVYANNNLITSPNDLGITNNVPDFIDSPELVLQNALRTFRLLPDTNYLMYELEQDNFIVLKNEVFVLYQVCVNNQLYYFNNLQNLKNELIKYIKLNSYKVLN